MRVYCETNFILELVFAQEESDACEEILTLARQKTIELALPAFSIFEAAERVARVQDERSKASETLQRQLDALERSFLSTGIAEQFAPIREALLTSIERDRRRLRTYRTWHLSAFAHSIPMTAEILEAAAEAEQAYSLRNRDAVIFASIIHDLEVRPTDRSAFATRDKKDFLADPAIRTAFYQRGCALFGNFADLASHLKMGPERTPR